MQSQDIYNRDFDAATAVLDRWLRSLAPVAAIDRENTQGYWRARLNPHEPNTCPAELMLSRSQTFDVEVGPEGLANQPVSGFALFLPLLQAVAGGQVVHRTWSALATGSAVASEILVHLAAGQQWTARRIINAGSASTELTATAREHVYVPYRRG